MDGREAFTWGVSATGMHNKIYFAAYLIWFYVKTFNFPINIKSLTVHKMIQQEWLLQYLNSMFTPLSLIHIKRTNFKLSKRQYLGIDET